MNVSSRATSLNEGMKSEVMKSRSKARVNILKKLLIVLSFMVGSIEARGQVVKVIPEKPKFGDTMSVTYDPRGEGAKLNSGEDVYVLVGMYFPYGIDGFTTKMTKTGDVFRYEFRIQQEFSAVQFNFMTLSEWKEDNYYNTMIYRGDGEPVKGAYQSRMRRGYKEMAAKELALYPDNYAIYAEKWRWARTQDPETYLALLKDDMTTLLTERAKDQPADLLYALSSGYLSLKQEEKSREIIRALFSQHPSSQFTAKAIDEYTNQAFAQQIKGDGPEEIKKLAWALIERYPDTEMARSWVPSLWPAKDFPLAVIETICQKWRERAADNPRPYLSLARAYLQRQQKMDQAASLVERGINLLLEDRLKLYDDIAGSQTANLLPSAYLISAEIALSTQNYAKALSAIKAAQALEKETRPKSYLLEGEIWRKLAQPGRAETSYLEAWRRGGKEAEEPLKAIFQKKNGNLTGFEDYLTAKKNAPPTGVAGKTSAPTFNVTSLQGEKFDLAALRGKVVVLNFWYIGCAPCRVEMPGLNQLVSDFKSRDVVFIAVALDAAVDLRTFLTEKPFKYHIVADGEKIAQMFDVDTYPTHIVINKEGVVSIRQIGGNEKRSEELRPFIERALNER